jgi:hypothetical protein
MHNIFRSFSKREQIKFTVPKIIHHNQVAVRVMQDIAGNRIFSQTSQCAKLLVYIILVILYLEHYQCYFKIFDSSQYTFTHITTPIVQSLSARKGGYSVEDI